MSEVVRFVQKWWPRLRRFLIACGSFTLIFMLILEAFNIDVKDPLKIGLAIGVVILLLEHAYTTIEHITVELAKFSSRVSPTLYTLEQSQAEMSRLIAAGKGRPEIELEHLGLDMHQALPTVSNLLQEARPLKLIYRALVLTHQVPDKNWPDEAKRWSTNVKMRIEDESFAKELGDLVHVLEGSGASCEIEWRMYSSLPIVHGFSLKSPSQLQIFALCRWAGARYASYNWGNGSYIKVLDSDRLDPLLCDFSNLFDSYFQHLWRASENAVVFKYPHIARGTDHAFSESGPDQST